jgi:hypothetical protein
MESVMGALSHFGQFAVYPLRCCPYNCNWLILSQTHRIIHMNREPVMVPAAVLYRIAIGL